MGKTFHPLRSNERRPRMAVHGHYDRDLFTPRDYYICMITVQLQATACGRKRPHREMGRGGVHMHNEIGALYNNAILIRGRDIRHEINLNTPDSSSHYQARPLFEIPYLVYPVLIKRRLMTYQ